MIRIPIKQPVPWKVRRFFSWLMWPQCKTLSGLVWRFCFFYFYQIEQRDECNPWKLTWSNGKNNKLKRWSPIKMVIFHCHVSFRGGIKRMNEMLQAPDKIQCHSFFAQRFGWAIHCCSKDAMLFWTWNLVFIRVEEAQNEAACWDFFVKPLLVCLPRLANLDPSPVGNKFIEYQFFFGCFFHLIEHRFADPASSVNVRLEKFLCCVGRFRFRCEQWRKTLVVGVYRELYYPVMWRL